MSRPFSLAKPQTPVAPRRAGRFTALADHPFSSPLGRRAFLRQLGLASAGLAVVPGLLTGCSDSSSSSEAVVPLEVDPSRPYWLQGDYAPVFDELDVADLEVRGRIPSELDGVYVRNGSNPQAADSPHWFFGDGMVHGVRIRDGKALWYRNRYVKTPLYEGHLSFGEPGTAPIGGNNQSNVSCVYHGGKLLTSGEVGFPHQLDPDTLETLGVYDFAGKLNTSFTAHPKIDPATGYLHFFGYWFVEPYLTYHVADATGRVIRSQPVPVKASTMIHSFAITERDVIFWELPVLFDLEEAIRGSDNPFHWHPEYGARIGIMPLGGDVADIRWVEIETCYVFHEVNAHRDGDDVVIDVCRHATMFDGKDLGQGDVKVHRWRIDTSGAELRFRDEIVLDRDIELPSHDRRFSGRKNRYGWFVDTTYHPHTINFTGIAMLDYRSGDHTVWTPGPNSHPGEAFFVPGGPGEGEGWIFTYVYDHATDVSTLAILDALRIERGPVAEVVLPRRVPYGFHGVWIPRA